MINIAAKVFVGNLAFQTTDQALAEAFVDCGKVKSGVVITRGRRSLGYGFVEFETQEEAKRAVELKNNTQIKGRQVKVELASDQPARTRTPNTQNNQSEQQDNQANAPARRRNKRRNRNRNNTQGKTNADNQESNQNTQTAKNTTDTKPKTRKAKKTQSNEDKVLSTTAVFVANLPFAVTDAELSAFFKEHHPKTAHVVVTRNGRSRGYGFVEFESENDQKAAIASKNKQKFTDTERELTVTASYKTQELTNTTNT
jgi:RNA recognition motif-containing protein